MWKTVREKKGETAVSIAKEVAPHFKQFSAASILTYVQVFLKVNAATLALYESGKISWYALVEICKSSLNEKTIQVLFEEYLGRGMTFKQLEETKNLLRNGKMLLSEALDRATGGAEVLEARKEMKRISKSFGDVVVDFEKACRDVRILGSLLMEVLPHSTFEKGRFHFERFKSAWLLRETLASHLKYTDDTLGTYFKEIGNTVKNGTARNGSNLLNDKGKDDDEGSLEEA